MQHITVRKPAPAAEAAPAQPAEYAATMPAPLPTVQPTEDQAAPAEHDAITAIGEDFANPRPRGRR